MKTFFIVVLFIVGLVLFLTNLGLAQTTNNTSSVKVISVPYEVKDYFSIWGKEQNTCIRSGLVVLLPGKNVGEHSTENFEELIIPLEGEGVMKVSNKEYKFSKNTIVHVSPQTTHDVFNVSKKHILKYIYVVANNKCNK